MTNIVSILTAKRTAVNTAMQPKIAEGDDGNSLRQELSRLVESGWQLDEEGVGVRKTYHLKTYTKVLVCIQLSARTLAEAMRLGSPP